MVQEVLLSLIRIYGMFFVGGVVFLLGENPFSSRGVFPAVGPLNEDR
jgi:hypothetical protein